MNPSDSTATRWFVAAPGPDETLSSVVGRAAAFYGGTVELLWVALHGAHVSTSGTPDHPSPEALQRMAHALGVAPLSLRDHRLDESPRWLTEPARRAYCPACWLEDMDAGRPLGYRRAWARVLGTHCVRHDRPLLCSHAPSGKDASWMEELVLQRAAMGDAASAYPDGETGKLLRWIDQLGTELDGALFAGASWPSVWRLDRHEVQRRLVTSCHADDGEGGYSSLSRVVVPPDLRRYIHTRNSQVTQSSRFDWEDLRSLGDPGIRRAALWLLGWQLVPGLPESWGPRWFLDP